MWYLRVARRNRAQGELMEENKRQVYKREEMRNEIERAEAFKLLLEATAETLDQFGMVRSAKMIRQSVDEINQRYAIKTKQ